MFQTARGTSDILPSEQSYWQHIEKILDKVATSFGFGKIETPIFEYKAIFERGIGISTDVVEKQMYLLKNRDEEEKEELALRPEGTAGAVRAFLQNGMQSQPQPVKLYYFGPMFRYERPQKGRFRQHHQFGFEIFGSATPLTDAFLISLVRKIYQEIGLPNITFQINSLGCQNCRGKIRRAIVNYYKNYQTAICPTCQNRLTKNPLRLLDCKEEKCQPIIAGAPALIDFLCPECKEHFKATLEQLEELNIPYDFNPRLARGLDYYTRTIFEVISPLAGSSLGGGGRYDNLVEAFGGKPTAALGFAGGIERIIEELKRHKIAVPSIGDPEIFLIHLGDSARKKCLSLLYKLYKEGFRVTLNLDRVSLKSQLKSADKFKASFVLILGQKETRERTVIVRNMIDGSQETVDFKKLSDYLHKRIGGTVKIKRKE